MSIDQSYNQWAASYDTNINKTRDLDQRVTQTVLSGLDFRDVLELGCGTGKNTAWLLDRAESIFALDFSEKMLEQARAKVRSDKVKFLHADLKASWPVADHSVDLVTCSLVLEHIEDMNPVFQQAFEKLRPGGYFFISELHPNRQYKGSQAKFETPDGQTHLLEVFIHHISEYFNTAISAGFTLLKLEEWFDDDDHQGIPRLVSFVFKK